nr:hypothetical protein [uncultured Pseudomonas sp.]
MGRSAVLERGLAAAEAHPNPLLMLKNNRLFVNGEIAFGEA